jgi:hypothetical protein
VPEADLAKNGKRHPTRRRLRHLNQKEIGIEETEEVGESLLVPVDLDRTPDSIA